MLTAFTSFIFTVIRGHFCSNFPCQYFILPSQLAAVVVAPNFVWAVENICQEKCFLSQLHPQLDDAFTVNNWTTTPGRLRLRKAVRAMNLSFFSLIVFWRPQIPERVPLTSEVKPNLVFPPANAGGEIVSTF